MIEAIQIASGGILQGCVYALLALGFSLIFRVTGVISLAQGAFCILGALLAHSLKEQFGLPELVAAFAAIAISTGVAALLGAVAFVPGLSRVAHGNMLMLTAGLLSMLTGAILVIWGSQPYALTPFTGSSPVLILGITVPTQGFWVLGASVTIVAALWLLLQRTSIGRALRACAENPAAAALMGISVPGMSLLSFSLAGMIGAIAGIVIAPITSLQFDTGSLFSIMGAIALAIGGVGSFPGAIAGGLMLGLANQLATAYVSSLFSSALALGLLLGVLVWRPSGLLSAVKARRQDVRQEVRVQKGVIHLSAQACWGWGMGGLGVALVLPFALPLPGLLGSLVIAEILFIALIGLNVLAGYGGQVSLGQAGFMAIGGYTAGYLAVQYNVPPLLGLLAGVAVSMTVSVVLALITMRLRGLYLALATLAFGLLMDSVTVGWDTVTGGPSGLTGIPSFSIGSIDFGTPLKMYYLVMAIILVSLLLMGGALRSDFGRCLQAIRTDQTAAAALGINVPRTKLIAFAIAAVFSSIAGSLYAFDFNFLSPDMVDTKHSFELITMLVIGGEGSLIGPLLGSGLLTMLPTMFEALSVYKTFVNGALLVVFFLYLPDGMFGGLVRLFGALGRMVRPAEMPTALEKERAS